MVPPSVQGKYVNSDFYRGGMMIHNAGSINPAKYHAGLVQVARKAGVRLIGHTRVAAVSPLTGVSLSCGHLAVILLRVR